MRKLKLMERTGAFASRSEERRRREKLKEIDARGGQVPGAQPLSRKSRLELSRLLRNLDVTGAIIREAMCWCLDHAQCAVEIARVLVEGLMEYRLSLDELVARLFLLSDVVHNSRSVTQVGALHYRREFEALLPSVFERMHAAYRHEESRLKAEGAAKQILRVLRSWDDGAIFGPEYVRGLEAAFSRDVVPMEALMPLDASVSKQLQEWQSQHFSVLEKIGKGRGLNWQTSHLEQPTDGRSLEDRKKDWILERLLMYELHVRESRRLEESRKFEESRRLEARAREHKIMPEDVEDTPMADIDGESLSEGELSDCNQCDLDGTPIS